MPKINVLNFAEMLAQHDDEPQEPHTHPPVREAALDVLVARWKDYNRTQRFEPGVLLDYKQGFDPRPTCVSHYPVVFVRYIDPDDDATDHYISKNAVENRFINKCDCIVMELAEDGARTLMIPSDSSLFQLAQPHYGD